MTKVCILMCTIVVLGYLGFCCGMSYQQHRHSEYMRRTNAALKESLDNNEELLTMVRNLREDAIKKEAEHLRQLESVRKDVKRLLYKRIDDVETSDES